MSHSSTNSTLGMSASQSQGLGVGVDATADQVKANEAAKQQMQAVKNKIKQQIKEINEALDKKEIELGIKHASTNDPNKKREFENDYEAFSEDSREKLNELYSQLDSDDEPLPVKVFSSIWALIKLKLENIWKSAELKPDVKNAQLDLIDILQQNIKQMKDDMATLDPIQGQQISDLLVSISKDIQSKSSSSSSSSSSPSLLSSLSSAGPAAGAGEGEEATTKTSEGEEATTKTSKDKGAAAKTSEGEEATTKTGENEKTTAGAGEGEGAAAKTGENEKTTAGAGEGEGAAAKTSEGEEATTKTSKDKGAAAAAAPELAAAAPAAPAAPELATAAGGGQKGGGISRKRSHPKYINEISENRNKIFKKELEIINSIRRFHRSHTIRKRDKINNILGLRKSRNNRNNMNHGNTRRRRHEHPHKHRHNNHKHKSAKHIKK